MKQFLKSMLSDSRTGEISSKRVIGTVGFLLLAINMTVHGYIPGAKPIQPELIQAVEFITIAALFGTTAEKFSNLVSARK